MEGTNKAHENGEATGLVGVHLAAKPLLSGCTQAYRFGSGVLVAKALNTASGFARHQYLKKSFVLWSVNRLSTVVEFCTSNRGSFHCWATTAIDFPP